MMGHIYKITNKTNGKIYIGQTSQSIASRWRSHKHNALKRTQDKFPLYCAIRKYGIENFIIEEVEECEVERLNEREIFWIAFFDSYKQGYNATLGGSGMKRVDINNIRRLWDKGYNLRKIVKETHFSIGSVKNALVEYEPFIKQRQSRYEKANKNKSYKWISVNQYSLKGEYIATYLSMTEAEKITGTDKSTIMRVCKGQQKYANGFLWKYADDTSEIVPQKTKEIGIIQYDLNHKEVARYKSIAEASKPPFNKSMIRIVANEKNRIYKGFYWEKSESEVLI